MSKFEFWTNGSIILPNPSAKKILIRKNNLLGDLNGFPKNSCSQFEVVIQDLPKPESKSSATIAKSLFDESNSYSS